MVRILILIFVIMALSAGINAQGVYNLKVSISANYPVAINTLVDRYNDKLEKSSEKVILKFQNQEARLHFRLIKNIFLVAIFNLGSAEQQCQEFVTRFCKGQRLHPLPRLDRLYSSIQFLQFNAAQLQSKKHESKCRDFSNEPNYVGKIERKVLSYIISLKEYCSVYIKTYEFITA